MALAGLRSQPLILVVDDDPMERFLQREALEPAGFAVVEAATGAAGLSLFAEARPDLVVLDVVMPEVTGFDVCRAIRAMAEGCNTPILMATGLEDVDSIEQAYRVGATDFIGKPINWPVLPHRVRYMLRAYESESAVRAARDEAQTASAAKTAFLAAMSHELRTPLNAIIGFSEMVLHEVFGPVSPPKYGEFARAIRDAGQRTLDAVTDVLTMAQLEAGRLELNLAPIDLRRAAEAALCAFRQSETGKGRRIGLRSGEERLIVTADEPAVVTVLSKLLSNAVKFSPAETDIELSLAQAGDGFVRLTVADRGIGMTAEEAQAAVRPFHQVDGRLARKYEGMGLGLSIAAMLMNRHGGRLAIESVPRQGTRILLDFPRTAEARLREFMLPPPAGDGSEFRRRLHPAAFPAC